MKLVPALAIKLALFPCLVYLAARGLGLGEPYLQAVTLAFTVFLATILSFGSLQLVAGLLSV